MPWSHPLQFTLPFPLVVLGNSDLELCGRARAGNRDAEERMVRRYLKLVGYAARDYRIGGLAPDDLRSVASVSLVKAVRTYTDDRIDFERYARLIIQRDMVSEVRRHRRAHAHELTNADDVAGLLEDEIDPVGSDQIVDDIATTDLFRQLASVLEPIEIAILKGKLAEKTDQEIGDDLKLSRITIWRRMQAIRAKLGGHAALAGCDAFRGDQR